MKTVSITFIVVLLMCFSVFGADKSASYGLSGGAGFTGFFESPGGYYGFNTFVRIDSSKNIWLRTSTGQINFGNEIAIAEAQGVLKFNLAEWLDFGLHIGANYDATSEALSALAGFEFECAPRSFLGINFRDENGYEKITFTPALSIFEVEGQNYSTFQIFINFAP